VAHTAAGFHRYHRARWHLRQTQRKHFTPEILPTLHVSGAMHSTHRKHARRQIHTD
jgi:hypothetical protein